MFANRSVLSSEILILIKNSPVTFSSKTLVMYIYVPTKETVLQNSWLLPSCVGQRWWIILASVCLLGSCHIHTVLHIPHSPVNEHESYFSGFVHDVCRGMQASEGLRPVPVSFHAVSPARCASDCVCCSRSVSCVLLAPRLRGGAGIQDGGEQERAPVPTLADGRAQGQHPVQPVPPQQGQVIGLRSSTTEKETHWAKWGEPEELGQCFGFWRGEAVLQVTPSAWLIWSLTIILLSHFNVQVTHTQLSTNGQCDSAAFAVGSCSCSMFAYLHHIV